jgi:hypothetical protein
MAKKLENMTQDERIEYWAAQREKETADRWKRMNQLTYAQRSSILDVHKWLDEVLDTALYPDMGGVKAITAYDLQELADAKDRLRHEFNFDIRQHG